MAEERQRGDLSFPFPAGGKFSVSPNAAAQPTDCPALRASDPPGENESGDYLSVRHAGCISAAASPFIKHAYLVLDKTSHMIAFGSLLMPDVRMLGSCVSPPVSMPEPNLPHCWSAGCSATAAGALRWFI